jgi:putative transposase
VEQLIAKYRRRLLGFDDKVMPMYARGLSVREIRNRLLAPYGIAVSPDLIRSRLLEFVPWRDPPLLIGSPVAVLSMKANPHEMIRNRHWHLGFSQSYFRAAEKLGREANASAAHAL